MGGGRLGHREEVTGRVGHIRHKELNKPEEGEINTDSDKRNPMCKPHKAKEIEHGQDKRSTGRKSMLRSLVFIVRNQ